MSADDTKKETDPNKKFYFGVITKAEREKVINELSKNEHTVKFWTSNNEDSAEEFVVKSFSKKDSKLIIKSSGSFLKKLTGSSLVGQEVYFKTTIGKIQYFSHGFLEIDDSTGEYSFRLTNDLFAGQQRSAYRLNCSARISVQLKINEKAYECLDISAGGTSFYIENHEKEKFVKNSEFYYCILRFNNKSYDVPKSIVAGVWEEEDTCNQIRTKIGIRFEKMQKADEEQLSREINSEARAEQIKKTFL